MLIFFTFLTLTRAFLLFFRVRIEEKSGLRTAWGFTEGGVIIRKTSGDRIRAAASGRYYRNSFAAAASACLTAAILLLTEPEAESIAAIAFLPASAAFGSPPGALSH